MLNEEIIMEKTIFITTILSAIMMILIIGFIITESIPAIKEIGMINFILGSVWKPEANQYGILPMIISTIILVITTLIIAIPLSLGCSIFITQYSNKYLNKIMIPALQTLTGIPSVVYGFFGLIVISPIVRTYLGGEGFNFITASIILSIMIMPTIITLSCDSLNSISQSYKESSLALGATKWQTIKNVLLPLASPGILTGIILAIGRIIGESIAVIMIAGNVAQIPDSLTSPFRSLTSNIALEMGYAIDLHYDALFLTGTVLLIVMLLLIMLTYRIKMKLEVKGVA
ncbi:phosphate ABC transporter permease subunit PstC [Methanosphaera sp. ISO3-F5]|uniref:phosphate ABC transporter permease subunit PstC n=1 Tax=Methanosphaera sp. ISO3-F5 TaxID=1452353 RepID=UPI002B25F940|nr:phosphate ABC transporter permease subunit PstC [Methanosphaera sp. ISO3-F5]WQH63765.1 phosphate ABC transporter permease subunit PstC [Methanosphaera sp. ISO3-F5]